MKSHKVHLCHKIKATATYALQYQSQAAMILICRCSFQYLLALLAIRRHDAIKYLPWDIHQLYIEGLHLNVQPHQLLGLFEIL